MKKYVTPTLYTFISLATGIYILIRAIEVGITFDEESTIRNFVPLSFEHIISYHPCDANNHLLNTLLIKFLFLFGNESVFIGRLPNVMGGVLYLIFAWQITKKMEQIPGILTYSLLAANPFLLDFFSLARGYGLAMGFLMGSLYYLTILIRDQKPGAGILSCLLGGLSVLSNFSLLNYFIILISILVIYPVWRGIHMQGRKYFTGIFLITFVLAGISYEPLRKMKVEDDLFYGGDSDFYSDSLISLVKYTRYNPEAVESTYLILNIAILIFCFIAAVSLFTNRTLFSERNIFLFLISGSISAIIFQHIFLGTKYPIDRAILCIYPIIILTFVYSLQAIPYKIPAAIFLFLVSIPVLANFMQHANLRKTALWYFDSRSIEILEILNQTGKNEGRILKTDLAWPFGNSIKYYAHDYPYVKIVQNIYNKDALNPEAEYYIYLQKSLEKVGYNADEPKILQLRRDTFASFPEEGIIVFKIPPGQIISEGN